MGVCQCLFVCLCLCVCVFERGVGGLMGGKRVSEIAVVLLGESGEWDILRIFYTYPECFALHL